MKHLLILFGLLIVASTQAQISTTEHFEIPIEGEVEINRIPYEASEMECPLFLIVSLTESYITDCDKKTRYQSQSCGVTGCTVVHLTIPYHPKEEVIYQDCFPFQLNETKLDTIHWNDIRWDTLRMEDIIVPEVEDRIIEIKRC